MEMKQIFLSALLPVSMIFLCGSDLMAVRRKHGEQARETPKVKFVLQSSAFSNNGDIPEIYTCDKGEKDDISPPLRWSGAPKGTKSFVLICEDPDAVGKVWVHWIVFNLPASVHDLPAKANIKSLKGIEGTNSWGPGHTEYGGPCPPVQKHSYIFTLYALDVSKLASRSKANRDDVMRAMRGHILGKAVLVGKYERTKNK